VEEDPEDLSDKQVKKDFILNYFFNMKDRSGLINSKTLKAEQRMVHRMIGFISLMCFIFSDIAMVIEFNENFSTEMIQDIMMIIIIVMKILLIVCLIISNYISKYFSISL
jgi:hypothetical protein